MRRRRKARTVDGRAARKRIGDQLAGVTVVSSPTVGTATLIFLQLTSTVSSADLTILALPSMTLKWKVSFYFLGSAFGAVVKPPIFCQSML